MVQSVIANEDYKLLMLEYIFDMEIKYGSRAVSILQFFCRSWTLYANITEVSDTHWYKKLSAALRLTQMAWNEDSDQWLIYDIYFKFCFYDSNSLMAPIT